MTLNGKFLLLKDSYHKVLIHILFEISKPILKINIYIKNSQNSN